MPRTIKAAQFVITLEVAFGLVGLAIMVGLFFASFDWLVLLVLVYGAAMPALNGWLLSRWSSRRTYLRWAIIGAHLLWIGLVVLNLALYSTVTAGAVFSRSVLDWVVIVLLLLPSAGRWFCRSAAGQAGDGAS
ncbi:hypothetical protein ACWEPC_50090 [Nonomuraea sp. NPDC004297]